MLIKFITKRNEWFNSRIDERKKRQIFSERTGLVSNVANLLRERNMEATNHFVLLDVLEQETKLEKEITI
jgi:hypothetical protein